MRDFTMHSNVLRMNAMAPNGYAAISTAASRIGSAEPKANAAATTNIVAFSTPPSACTSTASTTLPNVGTATNTTANNMQTSASLSIQPPPAHLQLSPSPSSMGLANATANAASPATATANVGRSSLIIATTPQKATQQLQQQQQQYHHHNPNQQQRHVAMDFASSRNNNHNQNNICQNNAKGESNNGGNTQSDDDDDDDNDVEDDEDDVDDELANVLDNNGRRTTLFRPASTLSSNAAACQQQQTVVHRQQQQQQSCSYLDQLFDHHSPYGQQQQQRQQLSPLHHQQVATALPTTVVASVRQQHDRRRGLRRISLTVESSSPSSPTSSSSTGWFRITNRHKNYALWFVTPVLASFAVAIVIASLAGPQWMLTMEKLPNPFYNGTANVHRPDDGMYVVKYTKSSLWIMCTSPQPGSTVGSGESTCTTIDYFPLEEYSPDPNDSTMAIPYAIIRSTPFFLLSGIALLVSYLVLIVAMCAPHQHHVYFFTSGILFIISGLIMLIGLIMYVSIFKAEIGSKLRPRTPLQPAMFTFEYGQSFGLYVVGFILTETVGVLNVFLFIGLQQMRATSDRLGAAATSAASVMPCFLGSGDGGALSTMPEKVMKELDCNAGLVDGGGATGKGLMMMMSGEEYYSPVTQRRYYLEKLRNCDVHQSVSNTNNTLPATSTIVNTRREPTVVRKPSITYSMRSATQQFPLTRSVSTATELFDAADRRASNAYDRLHTNQHNHHPSTNLRHSGKLSQSTHHLPSTSASSGLVKSGSISSILGGGGGSRTAQLKDDEFRAFCHQAGRRYEPKEIYFIDLNDRDGENRGDSRRYTSQQQPQRQLSQTQIHQHHCQQNYNLYASNSSLHKSYPKNLFELEQRAPFLRGIHNNIRKPNADEIGSGGHGGSQSTWHRQSNDQFSSQTLPRNFLKHNSELAANAGQYRTMCGDYGDGREYRNHDAGRRQTLQHHHEHQAPYQAQQHPQQNHRYELRSDGRSSYDNLLQQHQQHSQTRQHADRMRLSCSKDDIINWPNAIPASPSCFAATTTTTAERPTQQQQQQQFLTAQHRMTQHQSSTGGRHQSSAAAATHRYATQNTNNNGNQHNHQQHQHHNHQDDDFDTFDLDRMEDERRKSHASLFESALDYENGTAV